MSVSRKQGLSLTAELVARVERTEPDPGPQPGFREHTDAEYRELAARLVAQLGGGPLWLFAYGSLIWNPELDVIVEQRPAMATGWRRSFCLKLTRWRGTAERPALMLALDRGGSCAGIAYRLPDDNHAGQIEKLLRRELDDHPPTNIARFIPVRAGGEQVRALAFVADRAGPNYAGGLSAAETAQVLATAAGHWGSAATYLHRTVSKLEEHGIRDRTLWDLQHRVADEIRSRLAAG